MRACLLCLLVLAAFAPGAAAQAPTPTPTPTPTPPPEPVIAEGVRAGGIDVGGQTVGEATATIATAATPRLTKNLAVSVAGKRYRLTAKRTRVALDAERSAKRALYRGRRGETDVPLAVRFRRSAVKAFVARVQRGAYRTAGNASVRITLRRIYTRRSRPGRYVDGKALRAAIERALPNPAAKRVLRPGVKRLRPAVTANELPRRYGTVVTIDRSSFKLRLFKRLRHSKTYGIAIGAAGYDTPTGLFSIRTKQVNPAWTAPNRPWAGSYAGRTIPGGAPDNPLKARWLGVTGAVGIHGTGEPWSIGSRASHGCIRMRVGDVIDLYPRVPIGTPVLIR